jgi:glycosyltransferase involved in cell wall biosynthesis
VTPATGKFVCAFRGSRDWYQAPLALAEGGCLDQFITDAYATPVVRAVARRIPGRSLSILANRHEPAIPDDLVKCLWGSALWEQARHRLGYSPTLTWLISDRHFSQAAAVRARERRADLFLYSPYAWEAFVAKYRHDPKRVLFQYHPHPALERRVLDEDSRNYPDHGESFARSSSDAFPEALLMRERESWRHADAVVCSSTFTKRSLVEAGCAESICHVLPYGVRMPGTGEGRPAPGAFECLFVGAGGHRKGLHHLLLAWQRAALPSSSRLTLVCRVLDRGIEALAAATPRVRLLRGVDSVQLDQLYSGSTLFVMPSLVEGFGHVYLEALARGCPVLGTPNTCVPDLGGEADSVFTVAPGDCDGLVAALERLAAQLPGAAAPRAAARATAARFPWPAFRAGLRQLVAQSA